MEMSRAIPHLLSSGIRVVGIGLEPLGVENFVDGGYWKGELYIDEGKKAYKALQLRSAGIWGAVRQLGFNRKVKEAMKETKNVPSNFEGDGLQYGATFLMEQGGAMLLDHRQQHFADHLSPEILLETFGIDPMVLTVSRQTVKEGPHCNEALCM